MNKRKFQSGGLTQADRDAGLTEADIAVGLRAGKNTRISDEDRMRAIMNAEKYASPSIVDQYRDKTRNPDAEAFPVDMGSSRPAPRATPRAAPRATPRATAMPEEGPSSAPGTQMAETEPGAVMPRRTPRRGSYDRPGPIGSLIELIRNNARRGRGNPNPSIYRGENEEPFKKGGSVKKKSSVSSASKRGDGIATKGKTKGRMV
jgi:hypothetical protein